MHTSIYYNRRAILVCAALPTLASLPLLPVSGIAAVCVIACMTAVLLLWAFPAAIADAVAMSLTAAVAIPFVYLTIEPLSARAPIVWFWFATLLGIFFLWLAFVRALSFFESVPYGTCKSHYSTWVDLPVADVIDALVLRPGAVRGGRRAGAADENGFYRVTFGVQGVNLESFEDEYQEIDYTMRVAEEETLEGGGVRLLMQSIMEQDGQTRTSMEELVCVPEGSGTRLTKNEVHDLFSVYAAVAFWLQDGDAAGIRARLDVSGSEDDFVSDYPAQRTLLTSLARVFASMGLKDPD